MQRNTIFSRNFFSYSLFSCLIVFQIVFGIIPGWKTYQSDFPNYYTSSRLLVEHQNIDSIYNDDWFQQEIYKHNMNQAGKFGPFPPPTALYMLPLCGFEPLTAKHIAVVINVLLLFVCAWLFSKISDFKYIDCVNLILLTGIGLANNFLLGQFYLCLLFLVSFGYILLTKNKEYFSGSLWGMGIAIKYFPVIFLPALFIQGKKKTIIGAVVTVFILNLIAFLFFGLAAYVDFFKNILFSHFDGKLFSESKNTHAIAFQSWNSLLRNIFVYDAQENPNPLIDYARGFQYSRIFVYLMFLASAVYTFVRIQKHTKNLELLLAFSAITLLSVLPASATYHYILLSFPVLLIVKELVQIKRNKETTALLILYSLIGFLPFFLNKTYQYYDAGIFLSYNRLWLVTVFYMVYFYVINEVIIKTKFIN